MRSRIYFVYKFETTKPASSDQFSVSAFLYCVLNTALSSPKVKDTNVQMYTFLQSSKKARIFDIYNAVYILHIVYNVALEYHVY